MKHYLAAIGSMYPQAPCLFERMLRIFSIKRLAMTLSRRRAAVIKWSHIRSSSRRSSSDCAHWDWKEKESQKWRINQSQSGFVPRNPRASKRRRPASGSRWTRLRWPRALCGLSLRAIITCNAIHHVDSCFTSRDTQTNLYIRSLTVLR